MGSSYDYFSTSRPLAFPSETAYYNPFHPKVSGLWLGQRRSIHMAHHLTRQSKRRNRRRRKDTIHSLFIFASNASPLSPSMHAVNATQAVPFIRETSWANQASFQLEIETRSFKIPSVFRRSSTSPFRFLDGPRVIEQWHNFLQTQRVDKAVPFGPLIAFRVKGFLTEVTLAWSFITRT